MTIATCGTMSACHLLAQSRPHDVVHLTSMDSNAHSHDNVWLPSSIEMGSQATFQCSCVVHLLKQVKKVMLHLRAYRVLKSLLLLGILLTLIVKIWLTSYNSYEDGLSPSNYNSNYHAIGAFSWNIHLSDEVTVKELVDKVAPHESGRVSFGDIVASSETTLSAKAIKELVATSTDNPISHEIDAIVTSGRKLPEPTRGSSTIEYRGHVIAVTFWDQQTYSVGRLLSLQCWASYYNMVVVEPFMIDSKFGAPLTAEAMKHKETMVRLGKLYDLEHWNEYSKKKGYAPIVEWKEFLHQAPRNVTIVKIYHSFYFGTSLQVQREDYSRVLNPHGFQVVRELQYGSHEKKRSMDNFATHVFGNNSPSDVTIIFSDWSRLINKIVDLNKVRCEATHSDFDAISPSKEVSESAKAYIDNQFGGGEYNAVMLRLEWMVSSGSKAKSISSCLNQTIKYLDAVKNFTGIKSTFVAVDVGKYGSKTSMSLNSKSMLELVQVFLRTLYGYSSSLQHWEQTFEEISEDTTPGYIGYLQKVIATRAKCMLLIGGGTFQEHALKMYRELHRGANDACYAVAKVHCTVEISEGLVLN